jgi:hypothetical protein
MIILHQVQHSSSVGKMHQRASVFRFLWSEGMGIMKLTKECPFVMPVIIIAVYEHEPEEIS